MSVGRSSLFSHKINTSTGISQAEEPVGASVGVCGDEDIIWVLEWMGYVVVEAIERYSLHPLTPWGLS